MADPSLCKLFVVAPAAFLETVHAIFIHSYMFEQLSCCHARLPVSVAPCDLSPWPRYGDDISLSSRQASCCASATNSSSTPTCGRLSLPSLIAITDSIMKHMSGNTPGRETWLNLVKRVKAHGRNQASPKPRPSTPLRRLTPSTRSTSWFHRPKQTSLSRV